MTRRKLLVLVVAGVVYYPAIVRQVVIEKGRGLVDSARKLVPL